MNIPSKSQRILIIDHQDYWREITAKVLKDSGFLVRVLNNYDYSPSIDIEGGAPDLIVLGCASIKREERELIEKILANKIHLLVFSASLPWGDMRNVFLTGADDITDKSYDPQRLVITIKEAFTSISARNSYQLIKEGAK